MINFNKEKWEAYDPDKILDRKIDGFDESVVKFLGEIHPREDLMSFTHKESNFIVDCGYYGIETEKDGTWCVCVIDLSLGEDAWNSPIERHECSSFLEGIGVIQNLLEKYT